MTDPGVRCSRGGVALARAWHRRRIVDVLAALAAPAAVSASALVHVPVH